MRMTQPCPGSSGPDLQRTHQHRKHSKDKARKARDAKRGERQRCELRPHSKGTCEVLGGGGGGGEPKLGSSSIFYYFQL